MIALDGSGQHIEVYYRGNEEENSLAAGGDIRNLSGGSVMTRDMRYSICAGVEAVFFAQIGHFIITTQISISPNLCYMNLRMHDIASDLLHFYLHLDESLSSRLD